MNNLLLSDENSITDDDYIERKLLFDIFSALPVDFFSNLRHLQPQIGCLNACDICSQSAAPVVEYWDKGRLRNIVAALKYSAPVESGKMRIAWGRHNHRVGVVFPYLDNDIGIYPYLDEFILLMNRELGVKTRLSTIGYSRHNAVLNQMHSKINKEDMLLEGLGGVRLSFTPYAIGYKAETEKFSRDDYGRDMANFFKKYRPYFERFRSGYRKFCVELRYKPLVVSAMVKDFDVLNHKVLYTDKNIYISVKEGFSSEPAHIADVFSHRITLDKDAEMFYSVKNEHLGDDISELVKSVINGNTDYKTVEVYPMSNHDGRYYAIEPRLTDSGAYGVDLYPVTDLRKKPGMLITERFFLNALFEYKSAKWGRVDFVPANATWNDVNAVIIKLKKQAIDYKNDGDYERAGYIMTEIVPMIEIYVSALEMAKYPPYVFFDPSFTIDTGIICNLGRALNEFSDLTTKHNEPLTPNHERNYGLYNSTMTKEGSAWRLSVGYGNKVIIQKRNLAKTAHIDGQTGYETIISLRERDIVNYRETLDSNYLIPGQKKRRE